MRAPYCNTSTDLFGWISIPLLLGMVDEILCSGTDGEVEEGSNMFTSANGIFASLGVSKHTSLVLYGNTDAAHNSIFQIESVTDENTLVVDRIIGVSGENLKYRVTNDLYRHVLAATRRVDALLMDSAFVPFDKCVLSVSKPSATMELDYQLPYCPTGYQLKVTVAGFNGTSMNLIIKGYRESVSRNDIEINPEKVEDSETVAFTADGTKTTSKKFLSVSEIKSNWVTNGSIEINLVPPEIMADLTAAVACERIMRVKFSQSVPNASAIADLLAKEIDDMIHEFTTGQAGLGHFETLSSEKSAIRTGELFR